jgi:hypothetical protein
LVERARASGEEGRMSDYLVDRRLIATEDVGDMRYMRVVLRDDQFDLIREIVREEIRAARDGADSQEQN